MDNELRHWGIKGMRWGVRRYQNKDGSLTPAGKKRREQEEAAAEEAKRQHEEAKQKAIRSGTATEVMKFRGELDTKELQKALDRLDKEKQIRELGDKEIASAKTKSDKFFDGVEKATKYADIGIKAWNTVANIHNGLSLDGKSWAKIDTNIANTNKKARKEEQQAREDKEKAAKKEAADKAAAEKAAKAEKKAEKKLAKEAKKAEKAAKKESEKETTETKERETIDMELDKSSTGTPRYVRAGKDRVKEMFSEVAKKKSDDIDYDDIYTENGRKSVENILNKYGY